MHHWASPYSLRRGGQRIACFLKSYKELPYVRRTFETVNRKFEKVFVLSLRRVACYRNHVLRLIGAHQLRHPVRVNWPDVAIGG